MSNCCMRRPAKFHVDSAVRFWAIANIREGGGVKRPPPGQARVKCVIYDQICEPLHFCYVLGATLNAFKVTPITSIIMASFVDYERSMYPHWLA